MLQSKESIAKYCFNNIENEKFELCEYVLCVHCKSFFDVSYCPWIGNDEPNEFKTFVKKHPMVKRLFVLEKWKNK